jgi:hypothetical protein
MAETRVNTARGKTAPAIFLDIRSSSSVIAWHHESAKSPPLESGTNIGLSIR